MSLGQTGTPAVQVENLNWTELKHVWALARLAGWRAGCNTKTVFGVGDEKADCFSW